MQKNETENDEKHSLRRKKQKIKPQVNTSRKQVKEAHADPQSDSTKNKA
jgi:hypothetical protein